MQEAGMSDLVRLIAAFFRDNVWVEITIGRTDRNMASLTHGCTACQSVWNLHPPFKVCKVRHLSFSSIASYSDTIATLVVFVTSILLQSISILVLRGRVVRSHKCKVSRLEYQSLNSPQTCAVIPSAKC